MLDLACIFTTGGVLLFQKLFYAMDTEVINTFIKNTLLQEKLDSKIYKMNGQVFNWRFSKEHNLFFLVVYRELFQNPGIDEFVKLMQKEWVKNFMPDTVIQNQIYCFVPDFDSTFTKLLNAWEKKRSEAAPAQKKPTDQRFQSNKSKKSESKNSGGDLWQKKAESNQEKDSSRQISVSNVETSEEEPTSLSANNAKSLSAKERLELRNSKKKAQSVRVPETNPAKMFESQISNDSEINKAKSIKVATKWGYSNTVNKKDMDSLDFSVRSTIQEKPVEQSNLEYFEDDGKTELDASFELPSDDEDDGKNVKSGGLLWRFTNTIKSFTGNKEMTGADLDPVLAKMKEDLMTKNVAEEIARKICDSIKEKLLDSKTESFTSITKTVKRTFEETLTRILTPKRHIDVISEALKSREKGKPYVVVFIGVNGVGKSTNLAKIAYLFKTNGFSVMLAACDNFRAGAVEQIMTHGKCLDIPVFQRGYKDDPANIAADAYREGLAKKIDIILIDTAGRMQDNEPLMKSLSRLVTLNQPDLITFIGEALVGNDGVDQLTKFNSA
jgi:signal recognition particle receptor subunit alpha